MKKNLITIILSSVLILESSAQPLQYVVNETMVTNPEIQSLRKNIKAYRLYVDEERGKYLPTVSLDTYWEEKKTIQDKKADQRQSGTNTQLKLEQTLFDGGLVGSKVDEAKSNFESNRIKNITRIEEIVFEAIDAYTSVVKNEELLLLAKNNLDIHEEYLAVANESEEVSGDSLDRMQVESKLFSSQAKYVKLQSDAAESKANLVKLFGNGLEGNICRPVVDNRLLERSLESLSEEVVKVNFSVLEELANIEAQRAVLSQEQSRYFPVIDVRLLKEIDDGVDVKDVKKTENSIRLNLSYNIFNGLQDRAVIQRERIFLQESQKRLDNVVNTALEEMKINYAQYHSAKDRIKYLNEYLNKSKSILAIYLEQFEGGTRSFLDILNQEAEIYRSKTELIEEEYAYMSSYYGILNLLGQLSETVMKSKKQVCGKIKVDLAKRDLRAKNDELEDQELESLFEDDNIEIELNPEPKDNQEAEVKSMLTSILGEIYNPALQNQNISISGETPKGSQQRLARYKKKSQKQINREKVIKQLQVMEEQALRKERENLKKQIKDETQKIMNTIDEEVVASNNQNKKASSNTEKEQKEQKRKEAQAIKEAAIAKAKKLQEEQLAKRKKEEALAKAKKLEEEKLAKQKREEALAKAKKLEEERLAKEKREEAIAKAKKLEEERIAQKRKETEAKLEKQRALEASRKREQEAKEALAKKEELKRIKEEQAKYEAKLREKMRKAEAEKLEQADIAREKAEKLALELKAQKAASVKESVKVEPIKEASLEKAPKVQESIKVAKVEKKVVAKKEVSQVKASVVRKIVSPIKEISLEEPIEEKSSEIAQAFAQKSSKKYTIEILTLSKRKSEDYVIQRYGLTDDVLIYKALNSKKKRVYKVIYGVFDTKEDAKKQLSQMHPKIQMKNPLITTVSEHSLNNKNYNSKYGD